MLRHIFIILAAAGSVCGKNISATQTEVGCWTNIPVMLTASYPGQQGVEKMIKLLQNGASVHTRDAAGFTPLMIAANWGNVEMVELLLEAGADANATTYTGTNALHSLACAEIIHTTNEEEAARALKDIAALLIAAGANINQTSQYGKTPLIVATNRCSVLVEPFIKAGAKLPHPDDAHFTEQIQALLKHSDIQVLLEHGLDANTQTANGKSLIQMAVEQRNESAVEALLQKGANVNHIGGGVSVLWYAANHNFCPKLGNRLAIAEKLVNAGANPLQTYNGQTLLHSCAAYGDKELMMFILKRYPHAVDTRDNNGNTPLHLAAKEADTEMVRLLITAGADVNAVNISDVAAPSGKGFCVAAQAAGSSKANAIETLELLLTTGATFDEATQKNIMHAALNTGRPAMVQYLLNKGVNINMRLNHGIPLLQIANNNEHPQVMALLLAAGADVNAANDAGLTALHWAIQKDAREQSWQKVKLLLDNGADLHQKDAYGRTPLDCADNPMAELLRQHGYTGKKN